MTWTTRTSDSLSGANGSADGRTLNNALGGSASATWSAAGWNIASNTLVNAGAAGFAIVDSEAAHSSMRVTAKFYGTDEAIAICYSASNYYILYRDSSGFLHVYNKTVELISNTVLGTANTGEDYTLEYDETTGIVSAYHGATLIGSLSDSSVGAGKPGFYASGAGSGFKDFKNELLVASSPSKLGITGQHTEAITRTTPATPITVAVQDSGGATVTSDTRAITLTLTVVSGVVVLRSGTTTQNAVSGVATFNDLVIECEDGAEWYWTAADGALTPATTSTITGEVSASVTLVLT